MRHPGVFRTYFLNGRGDENMGTTWSYLDITALGRQEEWEDSPEGYPPVEVVELSRRVRRGRVIAHVGSVPVEELGGRSQVPERRERNAHRVPDG